MQQGRDRCAAAVRLYSARDLGVNSSDGGLAAVDEQGSRCVEYEVPDLEAYFNWEEWEEVEFRSGFHGGMVIEKAKFEFMRKGLTGKNKVGHI